MGEIKVSNKDFETLIICAFRYALGRRTYVVEEVCDLILYCKEDLSKWMLVKIQAEIAFAIDRGEAGMRMDEKAWVMLSRDIGSYLDSREELKNEN